MDSNDEDLLSTEACAQCEDDVDWFPSVASSSLVESQTPLSPTYVPRPVPWPRAWTLLVSEVRRDTQPKVWDILAGTFGLTQAFAAHGWLTATPIDVVLDAACNLLTTLFMVIVVAIICEGRIFLLHLGPPCSSFPIAVNSARASAVRSIEYLAGLPDMPPIQEGEGTVGQRLG